MKVVSEFSAAQKSALAAIVGRERFSAGVSVRENHRHDISYHRGRPPAGVVWPLSTAEVAAILRWSYEEGVPVTPWGAGTSTEGNPVPAAGGLVMDFTRMNRILAIRPQDMQADVQPGVFRKTLNRRAGKHGLFFPPDPGADATIGGMIANNASGIQTVRYGATKDYVMRLTVVLPGGEIIHTGCLAPKSSSGYDLTRLFVGSEGTLGVVTEASLRLTGLPAHHLAATIGFPSLEKASQAVTALIVSGLEPAALELLTPNLIRLMNREKSLGLPEQPTLFCEFHGVSQATLGEIRQLTAELCQGYGAGELHFGMEEERRADLWRARHEAWETIHRAHPGRETLIVDAAVPISRYPEMVVFAQAQVDELRVVGYVFGHAGDGNLHVVMVGDPDRPGEWQALEEVNHRIVARAVEVGGTCTGEHGVGIGKRCFMRREHGASLELMRRIKELVDPRGLMNPGKIFPVEAPEDGGPQG
ncbi:MAG: FAD-binding oxidoreductase [Deltaproteobacteria bacterium]|nr:FAD-binding oxidoreductase [Deltaproteobacteria bacterium]